MAIPYIKTEDLCFSYESRDDTDAEPKPVLKNISVEIEKGSFTAILGHNGSGKSTFAKLLNLLLFPTSGKIYIDGREITSEDLSEDELYEVRRKVGMVFQNPDNHLVATVVEEDIAFGPENLGVPPKEIRRRVDAAMELLGITEYARHAPSKLSGGQKQRVAIAGIRAMEPECIVFDEATSMLDPKGREEVLEAIRILHDEKGITVLYITHNMEEACLADRVIVMNDGELFLDGTPEEVFSHAAELKSVGLDVPQPGDLLYLLNEEGFSFPTNKNDVESVAGILAEAIRAAGGGNLSKVNRQKNQK